ncbi:hypothetical protein, partial [Staphylococcus aureus]
MANKSKGVDKNINPQNFALKKLIKQHSEKYVVGIHPSLQSTKAKLLLEEEITYLALNTELAITKSRQHYIFLQF